MEEGVILSVDSSNGVRGLKALGDGFQQTGNKAKDFGNQNKQLESGLKDLAKSLIGPLGVAAGVAAVTKAVTSSVQAFASYEKALVGVSKTTNLIGRDLQNFSNDIIKLTGTLKGAATANELLSIAQAAGQLGVEGSRNLLLFADTIAKLGVASDLKGDEAATVLTRILTVTGEGAPGIKIFASQIVALGNSFAATESEIARVANEVARSVAVFKVSAGQSAALAAALKTVGVQAELGGSAVGRAFRTIDSAVRTGGQSLRDLEKLTGVAGDELKRIFQTDAVRAFQLFIEGLGRVQQRGGDTTAELAKFNLKGEEILKVLPVLATRADLVAKALNTIGVEAKNGGQAIEKEAAAAVSTLDAKLKDLGNTWEEFKRSQGEALKGSAENVIDWAKTVIEEYARADRAVTDFIVKVKYGQEEVATAFGGSRAGTRGLFAPAPSVGDISRPEQKSTLEAFEAEKNITKSLQDRIQYQNTLIAGQKILADLAKKETQSIADYVEYTKSRAESEKQLTAYKKANEKIDIAVLQMTERQVSVLDKIADKKQTPIVLEVSGLESFLAALKGVESALTENTQAKESGGVGGGGGAGGVLGIISTIMGIISTVIAIIDAVLSMLDKIEKTLERLETIDETATGYLERLPQRLEAAFQGVGRLLGQIFTRETINQGVAIVNGLVEGIRGFFLEIFGQDYERNQTVAQTEALNSLADSIRDESRAIERAGWTGADWQAELAALQNEQNNLSRRSADYWKDYIALAEDQFDVIKELNQSQSESLSVLKGVLNSLEDTLNSLLGSTLNPDQTFASAQVAYNDLLSKSLDSNVTAEQRQSAIDDLTSFVTGFLEKAQEQFGSSAQYQSIFASVLSDLERLKGSVSGEITTTEGAVTDTAALLRALYEQVSGSAEYGGSSGVGAVGEFMKAIYNFVQLIATVIQTFYDAVVGFFTELLTLVRNVVSIFENIYKAIINIPQAIADALSGGIGGGGGDIFHPPALPHFAEGGVSTGPASGYMAMLHNTEAIIPLKSGAVPVDINSGGIINELKMQNRLLAQLINTTSAGLTIDGRSFRQVVSNVAAGTMRETFNRGRLQQAIVL